MQHYIRDLVILYKECRVRPRKLMSESPWIQKEFLMSQIQEAIENEKVEEMKRDPTKLGTKEGVVSIHHELKETKNPGPTREEVHLDDVRTR